MPTEIVLMFMVRILCPLFFAIFGGACVQKHIGPSYYLLTHDEISAKIDLNTQVRLDSVDYELLEWAVFEETNRQRERLGVERLRYEGRLRIAAIRHSAEMVELNYFDHTSPVPEHETIRKRLDQVGIRFGLGGENLAIHPVLKRQDIVFRPMEQQTFSLKHAWRNRGVDYTYAAFARDLVNRWLNSPPHRNNLLNHNFRFLGVGCVPAQTGKESVFYITQNFSSTNY